MIQYSSYIAVHPNIRFGKPCLVGTRITVQEVLGYLASGMSLEELLEDFPELQREHILAALAYAADKERRIAIAV
jgi:uncharacterized protein (DUF433 family)